MDWTSAGVIAVFLLAAFVRAFLGFGNALVAMPLLALFLPPETATPLVAIMAMVKVSIMLAQTWRHICFRNAGRLIAGAALGTPLGLLFLKRAPESAVQLALAVIIFSFSAYCLLTPRLHRLQTDRGSWFAGFVAGVLGGAYNTNGPPVVVYGTMRGWSPERFRATLQGFFLATGAFILTGHALAGLWTRDVFRYAGLALPGVLIVMFGCRPFAKKVPAGRFDKLVHSMLIVTALALAAKALL